MGREREREKKRTSNKNSYRNLLFDQVKERGGDEAIMSEHNEIRAEA